MTTPPTPSLDPWAASARPDTLPGARTRRHVLTVAVEDYFQVGAFLGAVRQEHWTRFESRLEANVDVTLELLARHDATATFFVLGCVAEQHPGLVAQIVAAGHEIASRGFWPRGPRGMVPAEFREDLRRTEQVLQAAGANRIRGFRSGRWLRDEDLWILDVLAEEGYAYDSSINPILWRFRSQPERHVLHRHRHSEGDLGLWEFPVSSVGLGGLRLPFAGGNWMRQLPHTLLQRAAATWVERGDAPLVYYFMPWELDPEQPRVRSISWLQGVRQYRNLAKTRWVLDEHLGRYSFCSAGDYLGIPYRRERPAEPTPAPIDLRARPGSDSPSADVPAVSLVVPMFDEELNVRYLARTLDNLRSEIADRYRLHLVLVDDGSSDGTWRMLQQRCGALPDCTLLRHERNQGVAGAILTGLRAAPTETVCSIDADLSYDPHVLLEMIPLLQDADLVTASPYHPDGRVLNVPGWRLLLSRNLSRMYSALLGSRLYTYTSCCRVYRKSAFAGMELHNSGFLGVAELLLQLLLAGGRVVEHPATLESRLFGVSKMRTLRTIRGHLGVLGTLARREHPVLSLPASQAPPTAPAPTETAPTTPAPDDGRRA